MPSSLTMPQCLQDFQNPKCSTLQDFAGHFLSFCRTSPKQIAGQLQDILSKKMKMQDNAGHFQKSTKLRNP